MLRGNHLGRGPVEYSHASGAEAPDPPGAGWHFPRKRALNDAPTIVLLLALLALLILIAFASGAEVAMLSVNRYRIRTRAQAGNRAARTLGQLLEKRRDWLGINLVIVTVASVFASQVATLLAQRMRFPFAMLIIGLLLAIVLVVFGELLPKRYAAVHSEPFALRGAYLYQTLVRIVRPILWITNRLTYGLLRLFGATGDAHPSQTLSTEGLRSVVAEAGSLIPQQHRQMLLSILDLGQVTVNDIMIPRQEISGIDITDSWEDILDQLRQTPHTRLPVYEGELDNMIGILHMKRVAHELARGTLTRERLVEIARNREPYFVPESTPLTVQLSHFQHNRRRLAFVVDEYGDIEGLVTLEDILEEIVGEFTSDPATVSHKDVHIEKPGVYIINASATIRALNRALQWQLPTDGPKTINGLLLEQLETIPEPGTGLRVGDYQFEVLQISDNAIKTVRAQAVPPEESARKK